MYKGTKSKIIIESLDEVINFKYSDSNFISSGERINIRHNS